MRARVKDKSKVVVASLTLRVGAGCNGICRTECQLIPGILSYLPFDLTLNLKSLRLGLELDLLLTSLFKVFLGAPCCIARHIMPKSNKNKRKKPVTTTPGPSRLTSAPSGASSNPAATRKVIRRFHVLLKRQAHLKRILETPSAAKNAPDVQDELASVEQEMERMGGLAAYQRMSTIGQGNDRGGGSEKVFVEWLLKLGERDRRSNTGTKMQYAVISIII